jgi:uncharacterized protein (DUF983 family)
MGFMEILYRMCIINSIVCTEYVFDDLVMNKSYYMWIICAIIIPELIMLSIVEIKKLGYRFVNAI